MKSVEYFKKNRIGALIVIEREISLQEYIKNSTKVYADLTDDLLETIFFPNSPMHDGGVIIQGDRITCAGAVFKTSMSPNVSKRLGTRHRAALGIAEESDAIALVVSEENGRISIACNNELNYNLTLDEFRMKLIDELSPKAEVFFEAEENVNLVHDLLQYLTLTKTEQAKASDITGKVFVITGSVTKFTNRNEMKAFIESRGGKVTGSVTSKTNYLINNDTTSNSSKNKTAKELGIPIISEEQFLEMAGGI